MTLRLICVLSKYFKITLYCAETHFAGGVVVNAARIRVLAVYFYMLAEWISLIVIFVLL